MPPNTRLTYQPPIYGTNTLLPFVREELSRREKNIGLNSTSIFTSDQNNNTYKGPMSAWVRVCSNALGSSTTTGNNGLAGFIMGGVSGAQNTFGFNSPSVIGYCADGKTLHVLKKNILLQHRACPGIKSIDVHMKDQIYRQIEIHWQCWSKEQLDYMQDYFFTPSISVVVEWGWNNYNPCSLLNLNYANKGTPTIYSYDADGNMKVIQSSPPNSLLQIWSDDYAVLNLSQISNGNYECSMGIVVDYSFRLNKLGGYDCITKLSNNSGLASGISATNQAVYINNNIQTGFSNFLKEQLPMLLNDYKDNTRKVFPVGKSDELDAIGLKAEIRLFVPRTITKKKPAAAKIDWDFGGSHDLFYVSFGVVIDFINYYMNTTGNDANGSTKFNIADTWISAHPNMKSVNKDVLLIPNQVAPVWTLDPQNFDRTSFKLPAGADLSVADKIIDNLLYSSNPQLAPTPLRQNLAKIIVDPRRGLNNNTNSNSVSFPRFGPISSNINDNSININGYAGKLQDLYVSNKAIMNAFSADKILDGLTNLLNDMSSAMPGMWSFAIRPLGNLGSTNNTLTIADVNFIGFQSADELGANTDVYNFKIGQNNSIVIDANFEVKLNEVIALQTFYDSNFSQPSTENNNSNDGLSINTNTQSSITLNNGSVILDSNRTINEHTVIAAPGNPNDALFPKGFTNRATTISKYDPKSSAQLAGKYESATSAVNPGYCFYTTSDGAVSLAVPSDFREIMIGLVSYSFATPIQHVGVMPGTKLTMTILGIGGIRTLDYFTVSGLLQNYSQKCIFKVTNITHKIENNKWITEIESGPIPLLRGSVTASN
jgi:hypothetical protein